MEPHELIRKIDDRILYKITEGLSFEEVITYFQETADKCQSRETFINVGLKYLINNWKQIDPNKKMNTLYVMFINKRLKDLKWLVDNKHKFSNLEGEKLYKLLRLRDKLDNK
jgi:predicted secreted Zn-dependent protease